MTWPPIARALLCYFLDCAAGSLGGVPNAAVHSRLAAARGSNPCLRVSPLRGEMIGEELFECTRA